MKRRIIMTKALCAHHTRLARAKDDAYWEVIGPMPWSHGMIWDDYYKAAHDDLKIAYTKASAEMSDFESCMILEGRGYRDRHGMFTSNTM